MSEITPISQKLGCGKDALSSCVLIKANVEAVSCIINQYFELEVHSHCSLTNYLNARNVSLREVERQRDVQKSRPTKTFPAVTWAVPFWQYHNHQWTVLPLTTLNSSIAFAFSLLLNADAIAWYESPHVSQNEFKVFRKDQLVEHYLFGSECDKDFQSKWDIRVKDSEYNEWSLYEHRFRSSIRQVTEEEIRLAFLSRKHDHDHKGFLDACLRYHQAYIPLVEETPYYYHSKWNSNFKEWDALVERMDMMLMPSNWRYVDLERTQASDIGT